jgi:CheY-like chemotaxis protein
VLHFVPTSSSWLNLIERWLRELTTKRIRRDSFPSVPDLIAAIEEFLEAWNENPKPFVWHATVESILAKLSGCRQTLEQIEPGCSLPTKRSLRRLSSQLPDTTLDVQMPVMDGRAFLRRARQDYQIKDVPIIVATAYPSSGAPGATAILSKPLRPERLLSVVRQLFQLAEAARPSA